MKRAFTMEKMSENRKSSIISVSNVSKKFAKRIKNSMKYGMVDLANSFLGKKNNTSELYKDEFWAVENINFSLSKGQILGIVGKNGSGKTTLLRMLAGIYSPDTGKIDIKGRVASLISLGAGFHPELNGIDNIFLKGTMVGMTKQEIDKKLKEIISFSELEDFIYMPTSNYSSGMRVRLGFSIATSFEPDVILLDEVLAVGDRTFKEKCFAKIESLSKNACTILVSHNIPLIQNICTNLMLMEKGKIKYFGNSVSEGIAQYNTSFSLSKTNELGDEDIILIASHWLIKDEIVNEPEIENLFSEDLEFQFSLIFLEEIEDVTINLVIFNNNFVSVADVSSEMTNLKNAQFGNGEHIIKVNIPNLELSPDRYSISIVVFSKESGEILKRFNGVKYFTVVGSFFSNSPFSLSSKWKIASRIRHD